MRGISIVLGVGVLIGTVDPTQIDAKGPSRQCALPYSPPPIDSVDVAPVPLGSNSVPAYSRLLIDAGIGDTLVVQFVVGTDGTIEPTSYCVERPSKYDSLSDADIRTWHFEPGRLNSSPVRARYRLEIVYSPGDTLRGPMDRAQLLSEVDQPGLRQRQPRLVIGPMRLTSGLARTRPALQLEQRVERAIVNRLLDMADVDSIPVVCLRVAPDTLRVWNRSVGAAEPSDRARCALGESSRVAEVWLQLGASRAGWYGSELIRIPAEVKTFDDTYCPPNSFMCGGGEMLQFDCEGVISVDRVEVVCTLESRRRYFV
jgi:hypothetical protein